MGTLMKATCSALVCYVKLKSMPRQNLINLVFVRASLLMSHNLSLSLSDKYCGKFRRHSCMVAPFGDASSRSLNVRKHTCMYKENLRNCGKLMVKKQDSPTVVLGNKSFSPLR